MEDFHSKRTGQKIEDLLDQIENGGAGGGDIREETDPIFSASPAATITNEKIAEWNSKSAQGEKGDKGDKGDTGVAGTNGKDGTDGEDGATFTPSVDSEGNLSWSNNKGLANPPTVNIKGPKGDKGDTGEGGGGKEYVKITLTNSGALRFMDSEYEESDAFPLEPNKVYYVDSFVSEGVSIIDVVPPTGDVGEYTVHFVCNGSPVFIDTFECPANWQWANGQKPTLENGTAYELSVVATKVNGIYFYKAVLTPFNRV